MKKHSAALAALCLNSNAPPGIESDIESDVWPGIESPASALDMAVPF